MLKETKSRSNLGFLGHAGLPVGYAYYFLGLGFSGHTWLFSGLGLSLLVWVLLGISIVDCTSLRYFSGQ